MDTGEEKLKAIKTKNKGKESEPFNYYELAPDRSAFPNRLVISGFSSEAALSGHFFDHAIETKSSTKEEYVRKAKAFLKSPRGEYGAAHVSKNGKVLRYDYQTHEYAVMNSRGTILSYFNPAHNKTEDYADRYYEGKVMDNA